MNTRSKKWVVREYDRRGRSIGNPVEVRLTAAVGPVEVVEYVASLPPRNPAVGKSELHFTASSRAGITAVMIQVSRGGGMVEFDSIEEWREDRWPRRRAE